jgi:hypothetical protein
MERQYSNSVTHKSSPLREAGLKEFLHMANKTVKCGKTVDKITIEDILAIDDSQYLIAEDSEGAEVYFDKVEVFGETHIVVSDLNFTHEVFNLDIVLASPSTLVARVNDMFNDIFDTCKGSDEDQ